VGDGVAAVSGRDSALGVAAGVGAGAGIMCVGVEAVAGVALGVGDDGVTGGSTVCVGDETGVGVALAAGEELVVAAAGSAATPLDGARVDDSAAGLSVAAG
jgi:hypothetical protein